MFLRKQLTPYAKNSILDVWKGSEYAFAAIQDRCKVRKKNSWRRFAKYIYVMCVLKYFSDVGYRLTAQRKAQKFMN